MLEHLEPRHLLATVAWLGNEDANWSNTHNWADGIAPAAGDTVVFAVNTNVATVFDLTGSPALSKISYQTDGFSATSFDHGNNSLTLDATGTEVEVAEGSTANLSVPFFGDGQLRKTGAGQLTLSAPAFFTGSINLQEGTLVADPLEAIASLSIVMSAGTTLDLTNSTSGLSEFEIKSLTGDGTFMLPAHGVVLGTDDSSTTFNGLISHPLESGFFPNVIKRGTGTLTANGDWSFPGHTAVQGGTLIVNGTIRTGELLLGGVGVPNGKLEGTGTIVGLLRGASGVVSPAGDSTGVLSADSASFNSDGELVIQLNGTEAGTHYDQLRLNSAESFLGGLQVSLGFDPVPGQQFTIVDVAGSAELSGQFSLLAEGETLVVDGKRLFITYVGGDGNDVVLTYAPGGIFGQKFEDINGNGQRDTFANVSLPDVQLVPRGPVVLTRNDDSSSDLLPLNFSFEFFGNTFTEVIVNNNGNITFNGPLEQFTPDGFPQLVPIIAPFWADVDTLGTASAEVHMTSGTRANGHAFVQIDWPGVGYFDALTDKLNDFSLYIEDDPAGDIVAFVYRSMQWTTGEASDGVDGFGGVGAQIGFDSGDGKNFFSLARPSTALELEAFRNRQYVFRVGTDGVPIIGEPGLDGWTIQLLDDQGTVIAETETTSIDLDRNGAIDPHTERGLYGFDSLPAGTYTVREVLPDGWRQTVPAEPGTIEVTLPDTITTVRNIDLGNFDLATIQGRVYVDHNGNGSGDVTELSRNGITIELVDAATNQVIATAVTSDIDLDGSGSNGLDDDNDNEIDEADEAINSELERGVYQFKNLYVGDFIVRQVIDEGWVFTTPATGAIPIAVIRSGRDFERQDFGNVILSTITGAKFEDLNENGLREQEDLPLVGWTIQLAGTDGLGRVVTRTTQTDDNGRYTFGDLFPGSYIVSEPAVRGWNQTFPRTEAGSPRNYSLAIRSGDAVTDQHFLNHFRPSVTFALASQTVSENVGTVNLDVRIDRARPFDVSIPISLSGSAQVAADYSLDGTTIVIPAQQTSVQLPVAIIDDVLHELSEPIVVTIGSGPQILPGTITQHTLTITDNDPPPRVSFTTTTQTVSEDVGTVTITVRLSEIAGRDITIPVSFTGTAAQPGDFTFPTGNVITIPAGQPTGTLQLNVVNDEVAERTETVTAHLGTPTGAVLDMTPGNATQQLITINDNDAVYVSFNIAQQVVQESVGSITVEAQLTGTSAIPLNVPILLRRFAHSNADLGSDFALSGTNLVFPANITNATAAITLNVVDDNLAEQAEFIWLQLQVTQDALIGATRDMFIKIPENDQPTVQFSSSSSTVFEHAGEARIELKLSNPSVDPVSVQIQETSGTATRAGAFVTDYLFPSNDVFDNASTTIVTFQPNQTTATFPVRIRDDVFNEVTETVGFTIASAPGLLIGTTRNHTLSIRDDDPRFVFAATSAGLYEGRSVNVDVKLVDGNDQLTTVNKELVVPIRLTGTAQSSDFTLSAMAPATISGGNLRIPANLSRVTLRFTAVDDTAPENAETVGITLPFTLRSSNLTQRPAGNTFTATIHDNDAQVTFTSAAQFVNENAGRVTLTVGIGSPIDKPITVTIRMSGKFANATTVYGGNTPIGRFSFPFSFATITIPKGQTTGSFTLNIRDDARRNSNQTVLASIYEVEGARKGREPISQRITILDNETPSSVPVAIPGTVAISLPTTPVSGPALPLPLPGTLTSNTNIECRPQQICLGLTFDGFFSGSTVFLDANRNGVLDFRDANANGVQDADELTEPTAQTAFDGSLSFQVDAAFDANGDGVLDASDGLVIAIGGVDVSTGLSLAFPLFGYLDTPAISPLTTLLAGLVEDHGFTIADAANRVAAALSLPNAEFTHLNAIGGTLAGVPEAPIVFSKAATLHNTFTQVSTTLAGLPNAPPLHLIARAVVSDMAGKITNLDSELDLTIAEVVEAVLFGAAQRLGLSTSDELQTGAATVIAAGNQHIADILPENTADYLEQIVRVQVVAQNDVAQSLGQAARGNSDISVVVQQNTGDALTTKLSNAVVGTIFPAQLAISDEAVLEGDNGDNQIVFTVNISQPPTDVVTVDYATFDDLALEEDGDYSPTTGTLTWNAGDGAPKTFSVTIHGDTQFEPSETLSVILSNAVNAVLVKDIGVGVLINDDSFTLASPTGTGPTTTTLRRLGDNVEVLQNDASVLFQSVFSPTQMTFTGNDNETDRLIIDLLVGNPLPADGLTFSGGSGSGDEALLLGGDFQSLRFSLIASGNTTAQLTPFDSTDSIPVRWLGVERLQTFTAGLNDLVLNLPATGVTAILEDVDSTDLIQPGVMRLRSPSGEFDPIEFTIPSGTLHVHTGNAADVVKVESVDAAFAGKLLVDSDFGDAPASYGAPYHLPGGPRLGTLRDFEQVPVHSSDANGDNADGLDDEDGVTIPTLRRGVSTTLHVIASDAAKLDAFFDFNGDGDFDDEGEVVLSNFSVTTGENAINIAIPSMAKLGTTFARFRISDLGGLDSVEAATGGEVEDYRISIAGSPWRNPKYELDVNNDNHVSPLDALIVINEINASGSHVLPATSEGLTFFIDVNDDNHVSPIDVLLIINDLNQNGARPLPSSAPDAAAEGESRDVVLPADNSGSTLLAQMSPQLESLHTEIRAVSVTQRTPNTRSIALLEPWLVDAAVERMGYFITNTSNGPSRIAATRDDAFSEENDWWWTDLFQDEAA